MQPAAMVNPSSLAIETLTVIRDYKYNRAVPASRVLYGIKESPKTGVEMLKLSFIKRPQPSPVTVGAFGADKTLPVVFDRFAVFGDQRAGRPRILPEIVMTGECVEEQE